MKTFVYCTVTGCWMYPAEALAYKEHVVDGQPSYTHVCFGPAIGARI